MDYSKLYSSVCIQHILSAVQSPLLSNFKTFPSPQKGILCQWNSYSQFPSPPRSCQSLVCILSLRFCLFWKFHINEILQEPFVLVQHNVFDVYPRGSMNQCFFPFYDWILFHYMYITFLKSIHPLIDTCVASTFCCCE